LATTKKEELREPDPFLRATTQLWDTVAEHAQQIGIGLAVLVVALMVFAGVSAHQRGARDEAGAALSAALQIAERPVSKEEEKPAPGETPDPDEKPFKTDADKQSALVTALMEVRNKYPQSEAGISALVPLGDAQLRLGKLDDAAQSYQAYVNQGPHDDPLRSLAELGLAKVAEAKKDYTGASAAYDVLMRDAPHAFLKDLAALGKARILDAQGQKQQAAEAYQQVKDGYPGSEASREAGEQLSVLAAAGIKPTPKAAPANADGGALVPLQVNKE
jgi:TolA-binding protein